MKKIAVLAFLGLLHPVYAVDWNVSGDFRYRFETTKNSEDAVPRNRHRIRARVRKQSYLTDDTSVVLGLATGRGNPTSRNETLDDGFAPKSISLDQAYLNAEFFSDALTLKLGKFETPFYHPEKSETIWDNDLTPEGMSLSYSKDVHINAAALWVEERGSDKDSLLWGADLNKSFSIGIGSLRPAVGYLHYTNTLGQEAFGDGLKGNTGSEGIYASEYKLLNSSLSLDSKIFGKRMNVYFEYVQNLAEQADGQNTAWSSSFSFGEIAQKHDWKLKYIYRYVAADAVIGAFSDSSFNGGGSDAKGHEVSLAYGATEITELKLAAFIANKSVSDSNSETFNRYQFDVVLRF